MSRKVPMSMVILLHWQRGSWVDSSSLKRAGARACYGLVL
jgi:hypothetical protein